VTTRIDDAIIGLVELYWYNKEMRKALFYALLNEHRMLRRIGSFLINPSIYIFPHWILSRADYERGKVDSFVHDIRPAAQGNVLLDAGAGNFRFRESVASKGYEYQSQDFTDGFDSESRGKHTYTCDIEDIPVKDDCFDVILCAQVLEHLPRPSVAFSEFSRILKPGGYLYLTTNFLFPIHGAPYDFFRFTKFSLEQLSNSAGLTVIDLIPRGGFFALVAKVIYDFPEVFKSSLFYGGANPHGPRKINLQRLYISLPTVPFIFTLDLICTILAFLISSMDSLDKKQRFTLGYQLTAEKKKHKSCKLDSL
jgi:SAM-dependent methyltransferase